MLEIVPESQHILTEFFPSRMGRRFPFVLLFHVVTEGSAVVGVRPVPFVGDRPTPWSVYTFLQSVHLPLVNSAGEEVVYDPWGWAVKKVREENWTL